MRMLSLLVVLLLSVFGCVVEERRPDPAPAPEASDRIVVRETRDLFLVDGGAKPPIDNCHNGCCYPPKVNSGRCQCLDTSPDGSGCLWACPGAQTCVTGGGPSNLGPLDPCGVCQ